MNLVSLKLKRALELRCKGLTLQVKLLLQPLKGQDPANSRPLCLLDILSGLKPIREGVIHTILSALVDISCPKAVAVLEPEGTQSMAKQLEASKPGVETLKSPLTEPRAGKSITEGLRTTLQPADVGIMLLLRASLCAMPAQLILPMCAAVGNKDTIMQCLSAGSASETVQRRGCSGEATSKCKVFRLCR